MFKKKYIEYLQEQLNQFVPEGYSIKVVEEYGFGANINNSEKFKIYVYVKFGVGAKQLNTSDRINQPVIFSIKSEGGDFRVAKDIFENFFLTYSKSVSELEIEGEIYQVWHNYNTPVVQSGVEQIGLVQRIPIIMTGVVSYSKSKLVGVKYYVSMNNGATYEEIQVVNPQLGYVAKPVTPQYLGTMESKTEIEGATNSLSFSMLADTSFFSKQIIDLTIFGGIADFIIKIKYNFGEMEYVNKYIVTSVTNTYDNGTGDNVLNITMMPCD